MTVRTATAAGISRLQIARYACAVGDFNPVHVDEDFARARGLPSVIAHGPLTASIVLDLITAQVGPDALRSFDVRLSAPVFPGDVLTLEPDGDGGGVVRKADGTVAAKVTIEVVG
jgi:acyl dehydratase